MDISEINGEKRFRQERTEDINSNSPISRNYLKNEPKAPTLSIF
jgi:hypothetical protein